MPRRWMLRPLVALSLAALAMIFLGCMSLSFGERTVTSCDAGGGVLAQEGTVGKLEWGQEREVYYPIPYASPPNLELTGDWSSTLETVDLLEQREDRFRIKRKSTGLGTITWKARGVRRPAPCAPATPPESVPPPLPDRPVRVETPDK